MKFEPVKKGPLNEIKQLEGYINDLFNDNFSGIFHLYARAIDLKLKSKIPEIIC